MYVEQTVRDIRYILTEGEKLNISLTELKKETISINDFSLNMAILGESHKIVFNYKNNSFTEVVACIGESAEKLPSSKENSFFDEVSYSFKSKVGTIYTDNIREIEDLFLDRNEDLKEEKLMDLDFPSEEDYKFRSVTSLLIKSMYIDGEFVGLRIKTLHTYPNENTCLITETILKGVQND